MNWIALLAGCALVLAACGGEQASPGTPASQPTPRVTPAASATPADLPRCRASEFAGDWTATDFSNCTVDIDEIIRGCFARDCIPALDAEGAVSIPSGRYGTATFVTVQQAGYAPSLPVAYVEIAGTVRGYPLHILTWHEIVNDVVAETPLAATFCPLCNTAIAYDRRVGGRVLDFGVSGNLRNSDLIMWDRQTESWWQQATGEGIVGTLAGTLLDPIPMPVVSFRDFAASFPGATVLSEDTGLFRDYGINPYPGYDTAGTRPFLFNGEIDGRLDGLERVLALEAGSEFLAFPLSRLSETGVADAVLAGMPVVVFWAPGTASALDRADIAAGQDVGAAVPYSPVVNGRRLAFTAEDPGTFVDAETGSRWTLTGLAVAGPLEGTRLAPLPHTTAFWFAWAAFHPETAIWEP